MQFKKPTRKQGLIAAAVIVAGLGAGGAAAASASGNDEAGDTPITGAALSKASAAALAQTKGGKVTATSVGDDGSAYEVEVTLSNGSHVDVQLDKNFAVLSSENEGPEKADGPEGSEGPEKADGPEGNEGPEKAGEQED